MNPRLERLHRYPFERLARLTAGVTPPADLAPIAMSIGEPRHAPPEVVLRALRENLHRLDTYPSTIGLPQLREACAEWLHRRYRLPAGSVDPATQVLPVNGTREALFAFVQAAVDGRHEPVVAMPNPFYQIYEGAALLAGAEPYYVNTDGAHGTVMNIQAIPRAILERTQVVITCSPGNPTGQVMGRGEYGELLELAHRHDFLIVADECYSEIYPDEDHPPEGLLAAAIAHGVHDLAHCVAVHSLSKRSNVPGLRFGFVAGDAGFMEALFTLRTYFGSAPSQLAQRAALAALADETHVRENRRLYREKFADVTAILDGVLPVTRPAGGFYLWVPTPIDDEAFVAGLYATQNLLALPGSYLSRPSGGRDPGAGHIRLALVGPRAECQEGAHRVRSYVESLTRSQNDTSSAH